MDVLFGVIVCTRDETNTVWCTAKVDLLCRKVRGITALWSYTTTCSGTVLPTDGPTSSSKTLKKSQDVMVRGGRGRECGMRCGGRRGRGGRLGCGGRSGRGGRLGCGGRRGRGGRLGCGGRRGRGGRLGCGGRRGRGGRLGCGRCDN